MEAKAKAKLAAWNWFPPARSKRLKRRQAGFALYDASRRPGMPAEIANAHARFEIRARAALRDWLML